MDLTGCKTYVETRTDGTGVLNVLNFRMPSPSQFERTWFALAPSNTKTRTTRQPHFEIRIRIAASGPNFGSIPTPNAAMMMENSPREVSANPARMRPGRSICARPAAQYPVSTFVAEVTIPKPTARIKTSVSVLGSI